MDVAQHQHVWLCGNSQHFQPITCPEWIFHVCECVGVWAKASELSSRLDIISSIIYYLIKWKYKCRTQHASMGVAGQRGQEVRKAGRPSGHQDERNGEVVLFSFSSGPPPFVCELTGKIPMIDLTLCCSSIGYGYGIVWYGMGVFLWMCCFLWLWVCGVQSSGSQETWV